MSFYRPLSHISMYTSVRRQLVFVIRKTSSVVKFVHVSFMYAYYKPRPREEIYFLFLIFLFLFYITKIGQGSVCMLIANVGHVEFIYFILCFLIYFILFLFFTFNLFFNCFNCFVINPYYKRRPP